MEAHFLVSRIEVLGNYYLLFIFLKNVLSRDIRLVDAQKLGTINNGKTI